MQDVSEHEEEEEEFVYQVNKLYNYTKNRNTLTDCQEGINP